VYFTDHGATGLIAFPDSVLQVDDLNKALVAMHKAKKYEKLVFYLEACESGSMFRNILPSNINIYAMTASSYDESSWGCYCDNDMNLPCLGDLFSVVWMQDSDKEDLTRETLQTQFDITKKLTNKSHVQEYGDLSWMSEPVGDFQGEEQAHSLRMWRPRAPLTGLVNSRDIPLYQLQRQLRRSVLTSERNNLTKQIVRMKQGRSYIDNVMRTLVEHLISDPELRDIVLSVHPERLTQLTCHKRVTQTFDQHCFNLAHNPYTLKHVFILANLCESGLDVSDIIDTMVVQCGLFEHKPNNVE
jgi:legumain